jgi:hypothetical protein
MKSWLTIKRFTPVNVMLTALFHPILEIMLEIDKHCLTDRGRDD